MHHYLNALINKPSSTWARAIEPDTDIAKVVAEAKGTGATGIKLYADLSPESVVKITKEAHRQGHNNLLVWEVLKNVSVISDKASNNMVDWRKRSVNEPEMTALLQQMRKHKTILDDTTVLIEITARSGD